MHVQTTSRPRAATPDWLKPAQVLQLARVLHRVLLNFIVLPYYRAGTVFGMQTHSPPYIIYI